MSKQTLVVDLGERRYPIHIGSGLLDNPNLLLPHIHGKQVVIVSNTTVAPLYSQRVKAHLSDYDVVDVVLPDGEQYKNMEVMQDILTTMLEHRCDRTATVIALGGGVVGDITGFASSCYQRGVNFIQIPTTLLSQVDSSVGGKTGVNHPLGKNMIGAFYQPQVVIIDIDSLDTLDNRQFSAGMAEVIKYGLLWDRPFLDWLNDNMKALMQRDKTLLRQAIHRSCEIKAEVVADDEKEAGVRALLNLGHTFGHAIENAMGYGEWLHGEAVGAGMQMAAQLSMELGWLSADDIAYCEHIIQAAGLPIQPPKTMTIEDFNTIMAIDKKVINGVLRLVLMKSLGEAVLVSDFDPEVLQRTLSHSLGQ
ncbi:MAG: 3-dehydroquinate synthase [Thiotrichaceae bacterium]|nr:3-dehydroquinate synthase [Thiotrichaceae bacterium]